LYDAGLLLEKLVGLLIDRKILWFTQSTATLTAQDGKDSSPVPWAIILFTERANTKRITEKALNILTIFAVGDGRSGLAWGNLRWTEVTQTENKAFDRNIRWYMAVG